MLRCADSRDATAAAEPEQLPWWRLLPIIYPEAAVWLKASSTFSTPRRSLASRMSSPLATQNSDCCRSVGPPMKVYVWHVILSWFSDAGGKKEKNAAVCLRVCRRRMAAISMVCDSRAGQVRPHCFCRVCRLVLPLFLFLFPVCAVVGRKEPVECRSWRQTSL